MTLEQKAKLLVACPGRRWNAVLMRGKALRDKLIENGVLDMDQLPHINYNAASRRQIAEKKGSNENPYVQERQQQSFNP